MKKQNTGLVFICGALLGVTLTLCLGAAGPDSASPKKPASRLQIATYPSGGTGFFDPDSGMLYIYDENAVRCTIIREIGTLGEPLRRVRN